MDLLRKSLCLTVGTAATLLSLGTSARAFSITPTGNANTLTGAILGSGITINSVSYTGSANASGVYTGGQSTGIGIDQGIILTTGSAASAVGPNDADNTTTNNNLPGDGDLDSLIPGFSTLDATVLTINFTTTTGDLFFDYVFASEEYNEFTNSPFNDVFGFFINGQNIALIPGTNTPVAINTVNGGNPLGVGASNPQFFNNNDPSDGVPFFNVEYDGFTDIFTASILGLQPGQNTIKLAIADAGDFNLDSAVFIKAGSFTDIDPDPEQVPEPITTTGALLAAAGIGFFKKKKSGNRKEVVRAQ